jgi:hypothetical protein
MSVHIYNNDQVRLPLFASIASSSGKVLFAGEFGTAPADDSKYVSMLNAVQTHTQLSAVWVYDRGSIDEFNITTTNSRSWMLNTLGSHRENIPTSLNTYIGDGSIRIYPSVSSDKVYFKNLPENSRIIVLDMVGRSVLMKNAPELNDGLSLQPYPKGVYIIRIIQETETIHSTKVLKN